MAREKKPPLSLGARVVLHCLIHGGSASICATRLPGFYRELLRLGLVRLDGDLEWQPTERGLKSNKKLLESGWKR